MAKKKGKYGISKITPTKRMAAPVLPYRPRDPRKYHPAIGLIGCGGITGAHLAAYKRAGYNVAALCDVDEERAKKRQAEFYPQAALYRDYNELLARKDIEVVDIATHPHERARIIEAALMARKNVLSQKPFVLDLDFGEKMVALAKKNGVKLAVNQNGRFSPHFSYIRQALNAGLIGEPLGVHQAVHFNHNWTAGTPFDKVRHLILYDFAIHWFDILTCFMGDKKPSRVFASMTRSPSQKSQPPLLAQALIEYDGAQASLAFDADTKFGPQDTTYIAGTEGSITSTGGGLSKQEVKLYTAKGYAVPKLKGTWFEDGFHGSMSELLCAIEEKREPSNSARHNLQSLALCFAACASAEDHAPKAPGEVRKMPGE